MVLPILTMIATALGVHEHSSAKETNEMAQRVSCEAQKLYDTEKSLLDTAKNNTEKSLLKLGYSKKKVLDCSMKKFLDSYDKIKHIVVKESVGLDEISDFIIDQQDAIQLREMSDIYSDSVKNGVTGAATGAVIALAASGSLTMVTEGLSLAGTVLVAGDIGVAAGVAGSALSFGASMTPLAAVAAPVVLFTGISANMKADENYEKACVMKAEAEAAVEKMKVSETLCQAIAERADMFNDVLVELDRMFSECVDILDKVIRKKEKVLFKKEFASADLSKDEVRLVAVTRSLAGAVKSIIDTPILTNEGTISDVSQKVCVETTHKLSDFRQVVEEVKAVDYSGQLVATGEEQTRKSEMYGQNMYVEPYIVPKCRQPALGIASFVLGILSVISLGLYFVPAIISIIFSIIVLCKKEKKCGLAIAGLVMSILSVICGIGIYIYFFWAL